MDPTPHEQAPALTHPLPPLARQTALGTVYHSVERPGLTSVFGTSVPPSGLSGQLRRLAYRWPEDQMRHWLTLMLADRLDVGEGLLADLARGHVPNLWAEMGLRAEWRHRRWRLLAQAAGGDGGGVVVAPPAAAGAGLAALTHRSCIRAASGLQEE